MAPLRAKDGTTTLVRQHQIEQQSTAKSLQQQEAISSRPQQGLRRMNFRQGRAHLAPKNSVVDHSAGKVVSTAATITGNLATTLDLMVTSKSALLSVEQMAAARQAGQQLRALRGGLTQVGMTTAAVGTLTDAVSAFKGGDGESGMSYLISVMPQVAMNFTLPTAVLNMILTTACGSDWSTRVIHGTLLSWQTPESNKKVAKAVDKQKRYDMDKSTAGYPAGQVKTPKVTPVKLSPTEAMVYLTRIAIELSQNKGMSYVERVNVLAKRSINYYSVDYGLDLTAHQRQELQAILSAP